MRRIWNKYQRKGRLSGISFISYFGMFQVSVYVFPEQKCLTAPETLIIHP
jgi:hypothetical protein